MLNKIITSLFLIFGITSFYAQEVEIKDGKVFVDSKSILKYEKINVHQHSFFSLDSDEEIIFYKYDENATRGYSDDDYFILNFLTLKKKVESKNVRLIFSGIGMNSRKNMEKLIGLLIKEKVLDTEGKLNPEKVEIFYEKYNEDITMRTVRY
ncbi:hypothetical protein M0M57_15380 [Flavobacterium azooxidireducens]|uniref:Uncharacterized protein n=1 Tax=Flavobacterium azooxidireducens TaxID=1871076 RepID=A0ABY4KGS8_9FLAO|nr:hypothetical protein [Flavobacterium azooxidireducens]UPQ78988.1 hypothetical protein M0M57_15380 [Flavobacterium azooxidireducens]